MTNEQQPPPAVPQQQQQPVNNPQNADGNATNDDPLTPITLLLRFLYTGTTAASIPVKSTAAPDLRSMADKLNCIIDMATAQPNLPVSTIRKVYETKMYVRVDEIFIALAFCARQVHSEPLRTLANSEAITMITNQNDFLLFVHYYMKWSEILRGAGHKHFGHGMCRVVEKWYERHTPIDLANMFGEHRGLHHLTHQTVIKKAHMRTKKRVIVEGGASASASASANAGASGGDATPAATAEGVSTAAGPSPKKARTDTEAAPSASNTQPAPSTSSADVDASSSTENATAVPSTSTTTATPSTSNAQPAAANTNATPSAPSAPSPPSVEDDREQVLQFVFCNGSLEYLKYLEGKPELGAGAERLKALQILKTNENVDSAVKAIQRHKFTIDQMPAHLLEQQKVWEVLLPTLSTRLLLRHFHTMKDLGFLNDGSAFTQKFLNVFGKSDTLKAENICPINVYIQKVLYAQNMRYLSVTKAEFYKKKMEKRKVTKNSLVGQRLDEIFDQTLQNAKPMPAKFFIVMDLRRGNAKKAILKNKQITCTDAAFVLAYSICQREKNTHLYSFTEKADELKSLHGLIPKNDFERAKKVIEENMVERSCQSLAKPIAEATKHNRVIDVFVVIVDSVARFCRQGQVPVQEFQEYRKKFNERAKYVVINMARPTPDLKIPATDSMKGFFEICGFNQDTPKILNALANHCFT